jgi:prolyl oligopeptidase
MLVLLTSPDDLKFERVILDPNKLNPKGATAIDFYVPSQDGLLVAVSLSENGSEDGSLHFFEVATGRELADVVPRVQYPTGGGGVAWNADGSGVFYTRYPHAGERPPEDLNCYQQIYFHKLGTPASDDQYELGRDFPRIAEISLETSEDGRFTLATVANGDGGEFAHYLRGPSEKWQQITRFADQVTVARLGRETRQGGNGGLYLLSHKKAPRGKILRLPLSQPRLARAILIVPEQRDLVIDGLEPAAGGVYIKDMEGGPSRLRFYDLISKKTIRLPLQRIIAVQQMLSPKANELLFRTVSYVSPYLWNRYDPAREGNKIQPTALRGTSPVDFTDITISREFATSKDGTRFPLNILCKSGTLLNGENPILLTGYGGYSVSLAPNFEFTRRIWFDQGGVFVVANLRGGGEYGDPWHRAGNLARKQNVFDDFAAAAEHLIKRKYTNPNKLALEGGSNGGLLMGATLTQHPQLARAVVSHVGIYDMLRVELDPNGAFNVTEFGTVKDPGQFQALYAYSPYHHVVDGVAYPAVLMLTGEHDGRVNPAQSRKMTARLQAASTSGRPILLRTSATSGHGIGTAFDERVAQQADVYAFLFDQLGIQLKGAPINR